MTQRSDHLSVSRQSVQKVTKVAKVKGQSSGRTYTSKYRGVHQTFPTKRWEAQFRYVILVICHLASLLQPRVSES